MDSRNARRALGAGGFALAASGWQEANQPIQLAQQTTSPRTQTIAQVRLVLASFAGQLVQVQRQINSDRAWMRSASIQLGSIANALRPYSTSTVACEISFPIVTFQVS